MEPSLKWAGNPNVIVVVKAFGMKATVQVIDLFYFLFRFISFQFLIWVSAASGN